MKTIEIKVPTLEKLRLEQGYHTTQEVVDLLGVPYGTLRYHVEMGRCPGPSVVFAPDRSNRKRTRRYYSPQDLEILRSYFDSHEPYRRPAK
jgi:MerR HTH family regulatory protein